MITNRRQARSARNFDPSHFARTMQMLGGTTDAICLLSDLLENCEIKTGRRMLRRAIDRLLDKGHPRRKEWDERNR